MIPIAGVIVLIYVVYLFFNYWKSAGELLIHLFTLNLIYEGLINVGYFVSFAGQTFRVADFLQFVSVIVSLFVIFQKGIKAGLVAFIISIIASVISLLINPFNEMVRTFNGVDFINNKDYMHYPSFDIQTLKTSLRLICFGINAYAIGETISYEEWRRIKTTFFSAGRIVISYAWIEFALKNLLRVSWTESFIRLFFGSDTSVMTSLVRNGFRVVIGFNNEPSQFCMMLFGYYIIYFITKGYEDQSTNQKIITLSGVALMVLSSSFRVVGLLPAILIIYLITSKRSEMSVVIMLTLTIVLILMYESGALDYYLLRLGRTTYYLSTFDTSIGGGEAGRLNTIVEALNVFKKRPFLGIGPGQTFCYGFIPCALVMTGIFGLGTWYVLMFGTIGRIRQSLVFNNDCLFILAILSIAWIYNDTISTGYSIITCAIALSIKFYNSMQRQTHNYKPACIYFKY